MSNGQIAIASWYVKWLTRDAEGISQICANRDHVADWERWPLHQVDNNSSFNLKVPNSDNSFIVAYQPNNYSGSMGLSTVIKH
jgi:hypothetical protein